MKLYLLTRTTHIGWDEYEAAIVAAENEEDAISIHPSGYDGNWNITFNGWENNKEDVKIKEIGEANRDIERGVILASFNAG